LTNYLKATKTNTEFRNNASVVDARSRLLNLPEALAFSALVSFRIWQIQPSTSYSWILIPLWLVTSFFLHKDTPKTLGWRADNLWPATKLSLRVFAPFIAGLCLVGLFLGGLHRPAADVLVPTHFLGYVSFCLLQQVGLNSYVTNRLLAATASPVGACLISGTIFGALHWPNPVLVPLTWICGVTMSWLFATERNILPLAFFQSILGTLVWWAFPVAWHHAMRVGPGFYSFHQGW
jgi:hypothetical protein